MNWVLLGQLGWRFLVLAFLAIGGANATLPEMHRQVVNVEKWMSASDFAAMFALGNAAPGPNVLVVTLVGWRVAGIPGALVTTAAMLVPTAIVTFVVFRLWDRLKDATWRRPVQNGLAAVTVGLIGASAYLLSRAADTGLVLVLVTVATAAMSYWTKLNPLWAFGVAAAIGAAGLA